MFKTAQKASANSGRMVVPTSKAYKGSMKSGTALSGKLSRLAKARHGMANPGARTSGATPQSTKPARPSVGRRIASPGQAALNPSQY